MMNYKIVEELHSDGVKREHIIIDNGDGSFVSMTKAYWDELEAAKEAQSL